MQQDKLSGIAQGITTQFKHEYDPRANATIHALAVGAKIAAAAIPASGIQVLAQEKIGHLEQVLTGIPSGFPTVKNVLIMYILPSYCQMERKEQEAVYGNPEEWGKYKNYN